MSTDRLLCLGGEYAEWSTNEFDFLTEQWVPQTPLIQPRDSFQVAVSDRVVYMVSGVDSRAEQFVETRDLVSKKNTCSSDPLPIVTRHNSCFVYSSKLFVVAGEEVESKRCTKVVLFSELSALSNSSSGSDESPSKSAWKVLGEQLVMPRMGHSSVVHAGSLWVVGGQVSSGERTASVELLSLTHLSEAKSFDFPETEDEEDALFQHFSQPGRFRAGPTLNNPRSHFQLVVVEGRLYAVGGDEDFSIEVLDEVHNLWRVIAYIPDSRQAFASCVMGAHIVVVGGLNAVREGLTSSVSFNTRTGSWNTDESLQPTLPEEYGVGFVRGQVVLVEQPMLSW